VAELPAGAAAAALAPLTGDAVAHLVEAAELLDVEVDQLAGVVALVAPDRLGRCQRSEPAQPEALQDPADGRRRDTDLFGDLAPGPALATQRGDLLEGGVGRRLAQPMRPRGAIDQACRALVLEACAPFVHGLDVDPEDRAASRVETGRQ
jgi:hypothetical protein